MKPERVKELERQSKGSALAFAAAIEREVVPEGYVVVPKVPTEEMVKAAYEEYIKSDAITAEDHLAYMYESMIAAAPSAGKEKL